MRYCLISSFVSVIGGASSIVSASRLAPSGPSPLPSVIVIVPLAPTPLTIPTSPPNDTCRIPPARKTYGAAPPTGWVCRITDSAQMGMGRNLHFGSAGQEGRQHRPGPVAQVLPAAPAHASTQR
jgi:hypothetical protein